MSDDPVVAIAGVTGAVGREFIATMDRRGFRVGKLKALASARSAGKTFSFRGEQITVEELTADSFKGVDIALFSAGSAASKMYAPAAVAGRRRRHRQFLGLPHGPACAAGDPRDQRPPHPRASRHHRRAELLGDHGADAAVADPPPEPHPARDHRRPTRPPAARGAAAMEELVESTRANLRGEVYQPKVLPHPYAFNLFSHNTDIDPETGYNGEETKVIKETRKIFEDEAHRGRRHLRARAGAARPLRGRHLRMREPDLGDAGAQHPRRRARRAAGRRSHRQLLPDAGRRLRPGRRAGRPHPAGSAAIPPAIRSRCSCRRISC